MHLHMDKEYYDQYCECYFQQQQLLPLPLPLPLMLLLLLLLLLLRYGDDDDDEEDHHHYYDDDAAAAAAEMGGWGGLQMSYVKIVCGVLCRVRPMESLMFVVFAHGMERNKTCVFRNQLCAGPILSCGFRLNSWLQAGHRCIPWHGHGYETRTLAYAVSEPDNI